MSCGLRIPRARIALRARLVLKTQDFHGGRSYKAESVLSDFASGILKDDNKGQHCIRSVPNAEVAVVHAIKRANTDFTVMSRSGGVRYVASWVRELIKLGQGVRLMPPAYVKRQ